MKTFMAAILLSALPAMAADVYTLSLLGPETITGSAGVPTATGWGYTIQNGSSTDWLVTTSLNASTFLHATPQLLFDFPDIAPGASVTVPYDPATPAGLYQILWDRNVPAGFVNTGTFTLSAEWWSGDPTNGGTLLVTAPNASQPYTTTVTPEPATVTLMASSMLLFGVIGVRRRWSNPLHG
jgi:hypothetical protein